MLKKTVARFPEKIALVCGELRITYGELDNQVERFSQGLTEIGVKHSDCVALILPNCPEFVISFYGIARIGAIALFLNPSCKENELENYICDSNPIAIITDITRAAICSHLISQLDRQVHLIVVGGEHPLGHTFNDLLVREVEIFEQPQFHEGDVLYQYSSGSTGKPKRVCRTQKNIFHEANNCFLTQKITEFDNIFCLVPFYHAYGFGQCLLAATYSGATLVILEPCWQNGKIIEQPFIFRQARVLEVIAQEKITILPAIPYIYSVLAAIPASTPTDLSTLRLCISAGNFLPKDIFDRFYTRFGITIRQLYGCTEAGAVAINMQNGANIKYDSIGLPMKNVEIKIMDEAEQELPTGTVGEIALKSQTLTLSYDHHPDASQAAFKNGYFLTGDLGKKDEDGYLYITGRKKFLIDTGGYKVNPLEVETVLIEHPKISEVVVVGVATPHTGQLVKAVIVAKGDCREQDIFDYCQDKLAEFKVPKIVEFRQEIPKSPMGKILREKLSS